MTPAATISTATARSDHRTARRAALRGARARRPDRPRLPAPRRDPDPSPSRDRPPSPERLRSPERTPSRRDRSRVRGSPATSVLHAAPVPPEELERDRVVGGSLGAGAGAGAGAGG